MQVLVRISWNMQSGKEGKDRERAIKLHITDSNYDRKTFILQQSLKRRKNSAWNVDLTKHINELSWIWMSQKGKLWQFPINLIFLPVLLERREAILYPSHKNQALEQDAGYPWKMKDLWLLHERSLNLWSDHTRRRQLPSKTTEHRKNISSQ